MLTGNYMGDVSGATAAFCMKFLCVGRGYQYVGDILWSTDQGNWFLLFSSPTICITFCYNCPLFSTPDITVLSDRHLVATHTFCTLQLF